MEYDSCRQVGMVRIWRYSNIALGDSYVQREVLIINARPNVPQVFLRRMFLGKASVQNNVFLYSPRQ